MIWFNIRRWLLRVFGLGRPRPQDDPSSRIQVLLLTILDVEFYAAVQVFLDGHGQEYRKDGQVYRIGKLSSANESTEQLNVAIVCVGSPGLAAAASTCSNACATFQNLKLIMVCGIAGGFPQADDAEKHVRLGDIVVGIHKPINVSRGKWTAEGFQPSMDLFQQPDSKCRTIAHALRRSADSSSTSEPLWEKYRSLAAKRLHERQVPTPLRNFDWDLPGSADLLYDYDDDNNIVGPIDHPYDAVREAYPNRPRVHLGLIACGDYVGKSATETKKRHSRKDLAGAIAYEMESSGVAEAATQRDVPYFVVRGIVDYQDPRKSDDWHPTGALRAAAMARCIVESRAFDAAPQPDRIIAVPPGAEECVSSHAEVESQSLAGSYTQILSSPLEVETAAENLQHYLDIGDRDAVISAISLIETALECGAITPSKLEDVAFATARALVVSCERGYLQNNDHTRDRIAFVLRFLQDRN